MGIVATMTAASPEGTFCSAHDTDPWAMSIMKKPATKAGFHSARRGKGTPRRRVQPKSSAPASKNRVAPIRNGGIVSTA